PVIQERLLAHCPHCGSVHFVKKKGGGGKRNNSQRFLCRNCRQFFVSHTNTILFYTQKDISVWQMLYVRCMMEKYLFHKSARVCGIAVFTVFLWGHKILDALQNMHNTVALCGVVEADETFTHLLFKGNYKNFLLTPPV
ncbi:unnamed protein product, partial [marine sediment metagenome]